MPRTILIFTTINVAEQLENLRSYTPNSIISIRKFNVTEDTLFDSKNIYFPVPDWDWIILHRPDSIYINSYLVPISLHATKVYIVDISLLSFEDLHALPIAVSVCPSWDSFFDVNFKF